MDIGRDLPEVQVAQAWVLHSEGRNAEGQDAEDQGGDEEDAGHGVTLTSIR